MVPVFWRALTGLLGRPDSLVGAGCAGHLKPTADGGVMDWKQAISLGVVQGLTEFLPVSSSAHVSLVGRVFGSDPGAAFTAVTQLGTEAAVLVYFREDIARIAGRWCRAVAGQIPHSDPDARIGWFVLLGSVPIGALGVTLSDQITGPLRNPWLTASTLVGFALVIGHADRAAARRAAHKTLAELTFADGVQYGLWQALALVPGVSRSGGTIAGGLLMGYSRAEAARYSFLLAIPAVLASGLYQLADIADEPDPAWAQTAAATAVSFTTGYAVIAWLLRHVSTHDYIPFVRYRVALGAALAAVLATRSRRRPPPLR